MAKHTQCPTCRQPKLLAATNCVPCCQRLYSEEDPDLHCDGSGKMSDLCETLVEHVHCPCGEPMTGEAEICRNYCDLYCLPELEGTFQMAPVAASNGRMTISHDLFSAPNSPSPFRQQQMVFNHGMEFLHFGVENALRWSAKQRQILNEDVKGSVPN